MRVFDSCVFRRISGIKRAEVVGGWRKRHNEELHNLYSLPGIIEMIKSRRMRLAGQVPLMERPLGRPRCRWRIILRWNLMG
jgi:hypothetical protein